MLTPEDHYDEFSMFADNASDAGLDFVEPVVGRLSLAVDGERSLSALKWGTESPELVLLHGGAQNAHTWDTVALALNRPLLAIDLSGHGHSDWRDDHLYHPRALADDVAPMIAAYAPDALAVVGMSLGGMTSICLADQHPALVRRLGVIDVTPGTDHAKAEPIIAFVSGPEYFDTFDEILARTIEFNPTRSESSLRRGVLHNAREYPDGRWAWRYDLMRGPEAAEGRPVEEAAAGADRMPDFASLWDAVDGVTVPMVMWRGGESGVVGDEDVVELKRRQPDCEVIVVEGAGHSIQGDKPLELAALIASFLAV